MVWEISKVQAIATLKQVYSILFAVCIVYTASKQNQLGSCTSVGFKNMNVLQDKMLVRVETAREETLHIREFDYGVPKCGLVPEASFVA